MSRALLRGLVALVAFAAATPAAHAGRSCEQRPPTAVSIGRALLYNERITR